MHTPSDRELLDMAIKAYQNAYAPYSGIQVGAALLAKDGKIYTGVNVENASFGATNCAERTAIFKAVSEGEKDFTTIAIASSLDHIITPCGICRQVMAEFLDKDARIILGDKNTLKVYSLGDILPLMFSKEEFEDKK